MSNSAWDDEIVVSGGLAPGQYDLVLSDIVKQTKVVASRKALVGTKIISREYDTLTPEQKQLVDSTPLEMWPDGKSEKPAFVNRIQLVFKEPESGIEFKYSTTFDMPSRALTDFITRATGIALAQGEGIKFKNLFAQGDKYVGTLAKNEKSGYTELDPKTVMKKELAKPVVVGPAALSPKAAEMLQYLTENYQGKPKKSITDLYSDGRFGTYQETQTLWQEIVKNVKYASADGKTLDFSEA